MGELGDVKSKEIEEVGYVSSSRLKVIAPIMLFLCMLTVLIKGGNSEGARLIICFGASFSLAATVLIDKHQFSIYEWLPGLTLFLISAVHIITHNLVWEEALLWGLLALSYWVILLCVSRFDNIQMKVLLMLMLSVVVFELLYGVFNRVSGDQVSLGLWEKLYYADSATGTFVNRNHFAGYLALTWPISLAIIAFLFRRQHAMRISLQVVLSIVFLFGLLLSKSRMGLFVGVVGVGAYVFWQSRQEFKLSKRASTSILVIGICVLFLAALWLGVGDVAKRYVVLGENAAVRLTIWRSMFDLPFGHWFWGVGVNEFEQRFPIVQPMTLPKRLVYAHNDYLQFVLEIGLLGVMLFVVALNLFVNRGLRFSVFDAKRRAAWCGVIALSIHEFVDFNLHMPGVAVMFFVLLGLIFNHVAYTKSIKPKSTVFKKRFATHTKG